MRKLAFFSMISVLFLADFGAFGAPASTGRARGTSASQQSSQRVLGGQTATKASATSARAATRGTTVRAPVSARAATTTMANRGTAARAATKKAISMGTKIESAAENTVVSEECRTAFYGCMDAFCMLESASGGRCQCSDRVADLNLVLDEIMRLDEQSLAMATEGVERLQMGENAEEIMARAKAAADSVTNNTKKNIARDSASNVKKTRTLDLSDWRSNNLFDDIDDSIFGEEQEKAVTDIDLTLADKTGDELQGAAAKICVERIPTECQASASFLHLTYAQKIKSDCTAYENSLKQQRNASAEKLQTAQKALRDTALEMYQNENKYDLGQCVAQFKQCMQTIAECGDDYSGCIADTAILGELYKKSGKPSHNIPTTVIKTGATSITISSATYDILNVKKDMCASVTKQCVNANKKNTVCNQVIKDFAPAIYTAEYNAASNNRMNCVNTVVSCVQKVCASKWDENSDNYDMCLSDPNSIDNYCSLEYRRCGHDESEASVKSYIMAKLAALKVDKCTKDVKECLLSEDRCGPDYENCVGFDTDTIVDLCPEEKLISCSTKYKGTSVRSYIARIAQGIALNIDNKFATVCQNAVDAAYARVCGTEMYDEYADEEEADTSSVDVCPNLVVSNYDIKDSMKWEFCGIVENVKKCSTSLADFDDKAVLEDGDKRIVVEITGGADDLNKITFNKDGMCGISEPENIVEKKYFCVKGDEQPETDTLMAKLLDTMDRDYSFIIDKIAADQTVKNCREGRSLQAISGTKRNELNRGADRDETFGRSTGEDQKLQGRFVNLLNSAETEISGKVIGTVLSDYYAELSALRNSSKGEEMTTELADRRAQIILNKLSKEIMQGKSLCDLDDAEYNILMSNEDVKNSLKKEQDRVNSNECLSIKKDPTFPVTNEAYIDGGWWKRLWFKLGTMSNEFINKSVDGHFDYKIRGSYNEETNVCTARIWTYECKRNGRLRKNRNICRLWNTKDSDATVSEEKITMPEWNDRDSSFMKGCNSKGYLGSWTGGLMEKVVTVKAWTVGLMGYGSSGK